MNLARKLATVHQNGLNRNLFRNFRSSSIKYEASQTSQPQVQEEKFDFEDLKVHERTERRKEKISPFMKDVFVSIFNRDLLAYPEILNKEESEDLEKRLSIIQKVFSDPEKSIDNRRDVLKHTKIFAAPVPLTKNGLSSNCTENIRYLEVIGDDFELGQEVSDHWVTLEALKHGLTEEYFNSIIDELVDGRNTVDLCIKEKIAERLNQADFRTHAELDGQGVWRISGEKAYSRKNGFKLVLATVEATRLKAFLIHPKADGIAYGENFLTFHNTIGTPLDMIKEQRLAQVLSLSRLYSATLSRIRLQKAVVAVLDYVKPRVFGGKPLSELPQIRAIIGDALLNIYASESTEYFTAGLMDGYQDPDLEVELAMCRNFMSNHGLSSALKLLSIPALDQQKECSKMFNDIWHLLARAESLDSTNIFIALTGIHHAGKIMSEEIKRIRNPLLHPAFIIKKALTNRFQEKDDPKLTLFLCEHLHPSLRIPSQQLEYSVLRMRFACEALMARHGLDVGHAHTELSRLAEAGTEILAMTAVLARASRAYCIGLRNAEMEMKLSATFVERSKDRVQHLIKEIDDGEYLNLDKFKTEFGKKVIENNSFLVEKPTARTFW